MKLLINKYWHIFCYLISPALIILGIFINNSETNTLGKLQKTQGKILSSETSKTTSKGASSGSSYRLSVKYAYSVNNKNYENNNIGLARFLYSSIESAQQELSKYPVGKSVDVYYLPDNPQQAYLDITEVGNGEMTIFFGFTALIFITPVVWLIRRAKRKKLLNS